MNTQRERRLEKFDSFRKLICLEGIINKSERPAQNLMENKKEAGMSDE